MHGHLNVKFVTHLTFWIHTDPVSTILIIVIPIFDVYVRNRVTVTGQDIANPKIFV